VKKAYQRIGMDQPVAYRIEVQGWIDERWSDWLEGMTVTVTSGEGIASITALTGAVVDQAGLQGLLRSLYRLGFPILSISRLESKKGAISRKYAA
jgi:hypothetical protein